VVVLLEEDVPGELAHLGVDVPGGGGLLAAHVPGAELSDGHEQVDVVGADEVLGHVDDGGLERGLAVVVHGVLGDVAGELRDLELELEVPLEAGEEDLPLAGLEPVAQRGDAPEVVRVREVDQLLVDEVLVAQPLHVVVHGQVRVVVREPPFSQVRLLLVEAQVDRLVVLLVVVDERYLVLQQLREVLLGLLVR
jgi:hypothetical protein